jgi:hypothetical protein
MHVVCMGLGLGVRGNGFNLIVRLDRRFKEQKKVGGPTPFEPPLNLLVPVRPDSPRCRRCFRLTEQNVLERMGSYRVCRAKDLPVSHSASEEQLRSNLIVLSTLLVLDASLQ